MMELDRFLKPMLKRIVLKMSPHPEVREQIRLNKASVNQIRSYLDSLKVPDFEERREKIERMRRELDKLKQAQEEIGRNKNKKP